MGTMGGHAGDSPSFPVEAMVPCTVLPSSVWEEEAKREGFDEI